MVERMNDAPDFPLELINTNYRFVKKLGSGG
jgi:hypothetical protein